MNDALLQIPARIKELREILDVSVEEMAEKLNIPPAQYVGFEDGTRDIPISTLYEIAAILNTDPTVLLTGEDPRMNTYTVVRRGDGVNVDRYPGYNFESLAFNFINRTMEPLLVTLDEDDEKPALVMHTGQEFNLVLEGTVEVTVGKNRFLLNAGDSIYFNPQIPHGQAAVNGRARFLTVINEEIGSKRK